jgi:electron-transferring-flavoprotein dehydrogenase
MTRETLDVDILIVGGGPGGLSAALRLAQLQKQKGGEPLSIALIEKSREAGAHQLSGALLDPSSLRMLVPDFESRGAPLGSPVTGDNIYLLTAQMKLRMPFTPPAFRNHGNYVISLQQFSKWMAGLVEAEGGVDVFWGFPGQVPLFEGPRVVGVRTADRGVGRNGQPKAAFEPGADIRAKVTIFADGVRGHLTKQLIAALHLDAGSEPAEYAIGLKEIWELPEQRLKPGTVIHTLGYPLRHEEFGGSFIYALPDRRLLVGFVVGLDYRDPLFDPHAAFQRFKGHPLLKDLLAGAHLLRYGAKALPEGGWNSQPRLFMDGGLIVGDAANFVNSLRLKGIHLAIHSGMLAAETAFEAVRAGDTSAAALGRYKTRVDQSAIKAELFPVRHVHLAFEGGLYAGVMAAGLTMFGISDIGAHFHARPGHKRLRTIADYYGIEKRNVLRASNTVTPDRSLTFDKVTGVHHSGTHHDEDQPPHLLVQTDVCFTRCGSEYGHPCVKFCPASVYEIVEDGRGGKRLQINASNCVHCKTCDIMDPYQVITWVAPEGGDGPQYDGM